MCLKTNVFLLWPITPVLEKTELVSATRQIIELFNLNTYLPKFPLARPQPLEIPLHTRLRGPGPPIPHPPAASRAWSFSPELAGAGPRAGRESARRDTDTWACLQPSLAGFPYLEKVAQDVTRSWGWAAPSLLTPRGHSHSHSSGNITDKDGVRHNRNSSPTPTLKTAICHLWRSRRHLQ